MRLSRLRTVGAVVILLMLAGLSACLSNNSNKELVPIMSVPERQSIELNELTVMSFNIKACIG
jgi:hypothetical protein